MGRLTTSEDVETGGLRYYADAGFETPETTADPVRLMRQLADEQLRAGNREEAQKLLDDARGEELAAAYARTIFWSKLALGPLLVFGALYAACVGASWGAYAPVLALGLYGLASVWMRGSLAERFLEMLPGRRRRQDGR